MCGAGHIFSRYLLTDPRVVEVLLHMCEQNQNMVAKFKRLNFTFKANGQFSKHSFHFLVTFL